MRLLVGQEDQHDYSSTTISDASSFSVKRAIFRESLTSLIQTRTSEGFTMSNYRSEDEHDAAEDRIDAIRHGAGQQPPPPEPTSRARFEADAGLQFKVRYENIVVLRNR